MFLALALASSTWADPFRPSVKDQIALGQRAKATVEKEMKVLPETDVRVVEMRQIGAELVARIPEKERKDRPFQYTFDVVDDPELNAFALPGGPIFFNSGLLNRLTTRDQVAGILAHEIIHVRNQHWASSYADNQKRRLGLGIVLTVLGAGDVVFDLASVADTVLFTLSYSRKHESEADSWGYDLALRTGYNPKGLIEVFDVLKAGGGGGGPEWLSTHPDTTRRQKALTDRLSREKATLPTPRLRNEEVLDVSKKELAAQEAERERKKAEREQKKKKDGRRD